MSNSDPWFHAFTIRRAELAQQLEVHRTTDLQRRLSMALSCTDQVRLVVLRANGIVNQAADVARLLSATSQRRIEAAQRRASAEINRTHGSASSAESRPSLIAAELALVDAKFEIAYRGSLTANLRVLGTMLELTANAAGELFGEESWRTSLAVLKAQLPKLVAEATGIGAVLTAVEAIIAFGEKAVAEAKVADDYGFNLNAYVDSCAMFLAVFGQFWIEIEEIQYQIARSGDEK